MGLLWIFFYRSSAPYVCYVSVHSGHFHYLIMILSLYREVPKQMTSSIIIEGPSNQRERAQSDEEGVVTEKRVSIN